MEYKGLNDYEVLYMIKERDEFAYNAIYDKYYPVVSNIANNYAIKYGDIGIEYDDLYQEGLVALNNAIREFKESFDCLFYTYVMVCIKRQMERLIKEKNRVKHHFLNYAISLDQEVSSTELKLEDIIEDDRVNICKDLENAFLYKNILDLKYELNGNQSFVYELKLNNFSNIEIAKLLDISPKTVNNLLKKIKDKLKVYVNENKEFMLYL